MAIVMIATTIMSVVPAMTFTATAATTDGITVYETVTSVGNDGETVYSLGPVYKHTDNSTYENGDYSTALLSFVSNATKDVTIKLTKDVTKNVQWNQPNHTHNVVIDGSDGNGGKYTLTNTSGNMFRMDTTGDLVLKDLEIINLSGSSTSIVQVRSQYMTLKLLNVSIYGKVGYSMVNMLGDDADDDSSAGETLAKERFTAKIREYNEANETNYGTILNLEIKDSFIVNNANANAVSFERNNGGALYTATIDNSVIAGVTTGFNIAAGATVDVDINASTILSNGNYAINAGTGVKGNINITGTTRLLGTSGATNNTSANYTVTGTNTATAPASMNVRNGGEFLAAVWASKYVTGAGATFTVNVTESMTIPSAAQFAANGTEASPATVTINGNNHTVTNNNNNAFDTVKNNYCSLVINEMTIKSENGGVTVRSQAPKGLLRLYKTNIEAKSYYGTITVLGDSSGASATDYMEFDYQIEDCNILEKTACNVICTGNANASDYKYVNLTVSGTTITQANNNHAINIVNKSVNSEVTVTNTTFNTPKSVLPINNEGSNTKLTVSGTTTWAGNALSATTENPDTPASRKIVWDVSVDDQDSFITGLTKFMVTGSKGTLRVVDNITLDSTAAHWNVYGNWVIDGSKAGEGRYTITYNKTVSGTANNGIRNNGTITVQNLNFDGILQNGCMFQTYTNATLTLKNVDIDAKVQYAIINMGSGSNAKMTLNLENVDIKATMMNDWTRGIIVTSNENDLNTCTINIKDSELEANGADLYACINANKGTTALIDIDNSTLRSNCGPAIYLASAVNTSDTENKTTVTVDELSTITGRSGDVVYNVENENLVDFATVKVGEAEATAVDSWTELKNAVNAATEDVVVEISESIYIPGNGQFKNANGKKITIDAKGNFIVARDSNPFQIATDFELKNAKIDYMGSRTA